MERAEKVDKEKKAPVVEAAVADPDPIILWKKIGGGSFRWREKNLMIKPGETFRARESEISKGFRDVIIPMEALPAKGEEVLLKKSTAPLYTLQPRGKSKSLFDVVNQDGKRLTGNAIGRAKAEKLIKDLEE